MVGALAENLPATPTEGGGDWPLARWVWWFVVSYRRGNVVMVPISRGSHWWMEVGSWRPGAWRRHFAHSLTKADLGRARVASLVNLYYYDNQQCTSRSRIASGSHHCAGASQLWLVLASILLSCRHTAHHACARVPTLTFCAQRGQRQREGNGRG